MKLCGVSAAVASTQRITLNHAGYAELALSNPRGKLSHLSCRHQLRQPVNAVQLLVVKRRELTPKTLAFSVPNENGEAERETSNDCTDDGLVLETQTSHDSTDNHLVSDRETSHDCTDDGLAVCSENNECSEHQDVEGVTSPSSLEEDISQSAEDSRKQRNLLEKLKGIRLHVLASEQWNTLQLQLCHGHYLESATNLIHYLALKGLDIKQLKEDLRSTGLLNLKTINSFVLACLNAGIQLLENRNSSSHDTKENISVGSCTKEILYQSQNEKLTVRALRKKLLFNKELLLGAIRGNRTINVMVTIGQEAIESDTLISDVLKAGASIIRINCAHGDPSVWSEIIRKVKSSSQMLEMPCRTLMDLAGPKFRTGKLKPGPCVINISPKKNATGNVILPAQVWLSYKGSGPPPSHLSPDAALFIDDQNFLNELKVGDTLKFYDARGKKRMLKITRQFHVFSSTGFAAECTKTAYIQSGTELCTKGKKGRLLTGKVVNVPAKERFIKLKVGDLLIISRDSSLDQEELSGLTSGAHRITCSSGYLFDSVIPGEPIAFDDGKIWGVIQGASNSEIVVSITRAGLTGTKLGSEKSINIPESNIRFEGLTSKDLMDLEFVASHADMVGVSFVRDVRDIVVLQKELEKRKLRNLGIVLKIETKSGFQNLPLMLLEAMKSSNPLGVMIARGDLAVECGWERLADIQEEILSVCAAAHVPVIWATQVLESLVKSGVPTRAEITDVVNGRRCIWC
ncbi:plastidial pyruvate kinase 4, chloroplastic-like isoform X2 [Mangifera indica]|uniref:plastidial pyruvate kinase 4, chloroplastic-like isoform X2 n=1 Tax=Mangifera indica TaxID=29780 RepID=UPI001CFA90F4|nr:plastidial pyruvate kinase 4, chloroplastic-like isoform X2 [Mangifera indica]